MTLPHLRSHPFCVLNIIYNIWWRDRSKVTLNDPYSDVHALCNFFSLHVGGNCGLLLWQRWWNVTPTITWCHTGLHLADRLTLRFSTLAWRSNQSSMMTNCGKPIGAESNLQPRANKKPGPSILQTQGNESFQQPEWTWRMTSPVKFP